MSQERSSTTAKRRLAAVLPILVTVALGLVTMLATGGIHTIGFWILALVRLGTVAMSAYMVHGFALGLLVALGLIVLRLGRALGWNPGKASFDDLYERWQKPSWALMALVFWFWFKMGLPLASGVRLPGSDPKAGTLAVMVVVAAVGWGVSGPIRNFRRAHYQGRGLIFPVPYPPSGQHGPEPKQEYWSDQPPLGGRTWRWDGQSLIGMREPWPGPVHRARCLDACSPVPGWSHTCGIYAVKDIHRLFANRRGFVFGVVELTGLVIEHEGGYRAEEARIIELWVDQSSEVARAIAARYPEVTVHHPFGH